MDLLSRELQNQLLRFGQILPFPASSELSPHPLCEHQPLPHSTNIPQRMFQDLSAISIHVTKPLQKSAVTVLSSDHNQVCLLKLKMGIFFLWGEDKYTSQVAVTEKPHFTKISWVRNVGKTVASRCSPEYPSQRFSLSPPPLPADIPRVSGAALILQPLCAADPPDHEI